MPFDVKEFEGKTSAELLDKIKELTEKVEKPAETPAPVVDPKLVEKPAPAPAPVVDPKLAEKPVEVADNKKLTELEQQNKTLSDQVKILAEDKRKNSIEIKMSAYADAGTPPVVIDRAKEILLSENTESKTFKFSEKTADGKSVEDKEHSFSECIYALLDSVPAIQLGESTVIQGSGGSDVAPNADSQNKDLELVMKYMETNKVDMKTAHAKLLAEKKIQPYSHGITIQD